METLEKVLLVLTIIGAVNWGIVFSTAGLAAILSILTSLGGLPECKETKEK